MLIGYRQGKDRGYENGASQPYMSIFIKRNRSDKASVYGKVLQLDSMDCEIECNLFCRPAHIWTIGHGKGNVCVGNSVHDSMIQVHRNLSNHRFNGRFKIKCTNFSMVVSF